MQYDGPFFHGSYTNFPMGFRLLGGGDEYEEEWSLLGYFEAIHRHAPEGAIRHRDAVFMCERIEDIDSCGGATDVVSIIRPLAPVSRHDMNWTKRISALLDNGADLDDPEVVDACRKYWDGTPNPSGEPLWEYLTRDAAILACCDYDDPEVEQILLEFWADEHGACEAGMAP